MQCSILSKMSFNQELRVVRSVSTMIASRNLLISHSRRCFSTNKTPPFGQYVLAEVSAGIATLTLNDAKKRNALSSGMMTELRDSIDFFESDPSVKVVVIRNDGKVFSSGHDLKELQVLQKVSGTTESVFQLCSSLMLKVVPALLLLYCVAQLGPKTSNSSPSAAYAHSSPSRTQYTSTHPAPAPAAVAGAQRALPRHRRGVRPGHGGRLPAGRGVRPRPRRRQRHLLHPRGRSPSLPLSPSLPPSLSAP
jgi:hypothetical protein